MYRQGRLLGWKDDKPNRISSRDDDQCSVQSEKVCLDKWDRHCKTKKFTLKYCQSLGEISPGFGKLTLVIPVSVLKVNVGSR